MKVKCCPKCDATGLSEIWANGRKLMQRCNNSDDGCYWRGEPYTPPKRRVIATKDLRIDDFSGWDYVVYDKYGHTMTLSQTFSGSTAAMKELERELVRGEKDENAGPYTGVLFKTPYRVVLKGTMFRCKKGKVAKVK